MKSYKKFLIGLMMLSGGCMVAADENEVEKKDIKALTLQTSELQISNNSLEEDEIEKFGEKILSGGLDKGEMNRIELNQLQEVIDWIQENMYRGVTGFYSNNKFVKLARSLAKNEAVELEFATTNVGIELESVEYISKIKVLNHQKVRDFLQSLNDATAEYNKKYPYRD